ncbi:hypothetical protein IJH89_02250 [Candidatus Saccharibacteria bacterium]|nr:hypothetical protein [Candidatus Saccharibacteria bacterium]
MENPEASPNPALEEPVLVASASSSSASETPPAETFQIPPESADSRPTAPDSSVPGSADSSPKTKKSKKTLRREKKLEKARARASGGKKSKKPLIISLVVLFLLALSGGLFYYFKFLKPAPAPEKSVAELLVEVESWEKLDASSVIWVFRSDGNGELTTNKENYYKTSWSLSSDSSLKITTSWLYSLDDSFSFTLDRTAPSFTVVNDKDGTVSTFVPLGTSASNDASETSAPSEETPAE